MWHDDILLPGRTLLNPDFLAMAKLAAQKKIYVSTSTNAHYLDDVTAKKVVESGLQKLILSIDGVTQGPTSNTVSAGSWKKCWKVRATW
jgi:MoaA/NifB/PqqE/SkfB family radical SAM enzyme